jgi:hypothetical protein
MLCILWADIDCKVYVVAIMGRECSVGIATYYGLGGQGIESQLERYFLRSFIPARGPHPASFKTATRSFPGVKWPWHSLDPSSAYVKERVELII